VSVPVVVPPPDMPRSLKLKKMPTTFDEVIKIRGKRVRD